METFKRNVKRTIEKARENVTTYGYHFFFSLRLPTKITGRTGRTQGARIVRIPAINDINASESII